MANIVEAVASNVGQYLAGPVIREIQYLLCANYVINDFENEKEALTFERDNVVTRIAQAKERTEVIEKPVEKWLNSVENILREAEVLVQRTETDNNCFQGWFPTCGRYFLCKEMVVKIEAMGKFKGKSNYILPFSHRAPLPGIQYHSSEDFIYFESTRVAYQELFKTLQDDSIHMIGLYGEGGSGKTTLVIEVGNKVDRLNMFDKVISITVSKTPNIREIQEEIADMLNLKLEEGSERGRAQRLWMWLKEKKRILIIVDGLWRKFNLEDIGICLNSSNKGAWKIIVTTRDQDVCTLMNCQKKIHLEILSEDESWTWFQELANIDDDISNSMDGVPREVCDECKGLPIAIKTVASSLKGMQKPKWESALANLRDSEAIDDHEGTMRHAMNRLKLSFDCLPRPETQQLFLLCPLYPEGYHIPTEDLMRYALGLGVGEMLLLQSSRSLIQTDINKLIESGLLMRGYAKMHDMVRDTALWIANRSDNNKILVNVDKPLSIVANDNRIRDCFAVSSWWYDENPSFCKLYAPNLKMLLVNISAHGSLNSLDLSPLTFEGIQGLEVFSLTINYKVVPISFPPSIQLLTNVRTLRLNGLKFGDISFIASLTKLEVLDLRRCEFKELPIEIGKLRSLKLLDLSECHIFQYKYNGAIGKCSELEELYASKCYPDEYVHEIILDIGILQNLQRFVLGDPIIPERTRVVQVNDFDISKLRTSNKNIMQIAETISLEGLHGGCKNIIPDMVGVVGGMNSLSSLHLIDCEEIECILDATYDNFIQVEAIMLFELRLKRCKELKHIIASSRSDLGGFKFNINPTPMNSHFLMSKLRKIDIFNCESLESIFPFCYVEGLSQLQNMSIEMAPKLEYVFGESDPECFSLNQNRNHVMLPHLETLNLVHLDNLIGMCPENCHAKWPTQSLRILAILGCPKLAIPWFNLKVGYEKSQHHLNEVWSLQSLQSLTLGDCEELKYLFSMEIHRNLPELMELRLYDCHELEQIVAANEEVVENPNAELYFPKLKQITVFNCNMIKSLFPLSMVTMLPQLSTLCLSNATQLQEVFRHSQGDGVMNEFQIVLPNLTEITMVNLPNFVDICHGSKVHAVKLQKLSITNCPKTDSSLRTIQIWSLQCLQSLTLADYEELKWLFSMETHRSLPELMYLSVSNCKELEQIVAANEERVELPNVELYFPKLKEIEVSNCDKLKSLFPLSMVTMLPQLSTLHISNATQLQEVFRHSQEDGVMNELEIVLPNLTEITLADLPNFVDICHGSKLHAVKLQKLSISNCPKTASSLRIIEIWSLQCLQSLTLSYCEELKCLFSMETHRSLPELVYLHVLNCKELEQIVAVEEELVQLPNTELYFPKLKEIEVENCNKLKSLFPLSMVTMLPQLSTLLLSNATQLQEVFRHSQGDDVLNELEIVLPNLTEITLSGLTNFVDIFHGSKLHAVKLQKLSISNCPRTSSSLRIIERKLMKDAVSEDDGDSFYQHRIPSMRNYV